VSLQTRSLRGVYVLSWSSWEHFLATQQEMSPMNDWVVQMHSTSMPQLAGMASVAQSLCVLASVLPFFCLGKPSV
jgi:hypothetical protein